MPEWVEVEKDLGDGRGLRKFRRETNTMPNWAGSCWYYLRYLDPANHDAFVDPANEAYWLGRHDTPVAGAPAGTRDPGGVDLYVGGVEHAVLHLLYARFWHKVLFDLGHVRSEEPFRKYFSQGYIQAYAYTDSRGQYVTASEVEEHAGGHGEEPTFTWEGQPVNREYGKIGKSLKNSVSPTRCTTRTAPTPSASTRCRWARSSCPSRGRSARSSAASASCNACGAT